jgi:L,D-transpeptidase-like protein
MSRSWSRRVFVLRAVFPLFGLVLMLTSVPAGAGIVVTVDKSAQQLCAEIDGSRLHRWPVSTGRWGYNTPNGSYRPQWLARKWFSRKYDWSPMPYSIFFNGGYAIHGSYEVSRLGRPASHGCIRLHPKNAAVLFALVNNRKDDTSIVVTGHAPVQRERIGDEGSPGYSGRGFEDNFDNPWGGYRAYPNWRYWR